MPIPPLTPRRRNYGNLGRIAFSPKQILKKSLLKKILFALLLLAAAGAVFGTIAIAWISRELPDPNKLNDREVAESTKIYDRTGEQLLYEVFQDKKRTLINLDEINPLAVKATIAIEDKYFYDHKGIRVTSIIRAAFNNLIGRKSGSGGASTLTQQLTKVTMVGDEHSYWRKIKEAILALQIEKKYSKDEILKMYLNEIPYGSTNYGIEAASVSYFHKKAKDLDAAEAATLAGIIKAPSRYLGNPIALRERRDYILDLMFEQGYISEQEKKAAQDSALRIYHNSKIFDAPHFVLYIKQILADQFGEREVDTGGLKVITTLDYPKQKIAQDTVKEMGDKFAKDANANNASLVAMDPKTGQVLAMVGSRDYENDEIDGKFNVAVLGRRQPGSSFKPFVYTAAWEKGYTPETVLYDTLTNFEQRADKKPYQPKNYDGKEHGLVSMRSALQGSLNIPAVKTLYLVGAENMLQYAKRFGYSTFTGDPGLSLVLGGAEVSLLEHTAAYAALADNGVYHAPVSILKVTNSKGETLYEWKEDAGTEAVKPEIAALTSSVLSDNNARAYIFGVNNTLILPGRSVAAKTGTTNDYKDAWTMGYTPSLATGVWVGNTTPATMKGGGNTLAGKIWNKFMLESLKDTPVEEFPAPPMNDAQKPILSGLNAGLGGLRLRINKLTGKIAASTTPEAFVVEKTYLLPHDILYYVNKDDPRGPQPSNPGDDPQYMAWENGLADWVRREQEAGRQIVLEEPPTEFDPPVSPELMPTVEIISPANSSTLYSRQLLLQANATAPRGVSQVAFYIDTTLVGYATGFPFTFSYYAKYLTQGNHTLKAVAKDDLGNWNEAQIIFNLAAPMDPADVDWIDTSPMNLTADSFPRAIYLNPWRWDAIKDIKIFLKSSSSNRLIYTFNHTEDKLVDRKLMFTWRTNPGAGSYILQAVLTDTSGRTTNKDLYVEVR